MDKNDVYVIKTHINELPPFIKFEEKLWCKIQADGD
jgi:hypothetical protein